MMSEVWSLVAAFLLSPTVLLVVSSLLKIAFVLSILLGVAPILVWAERRQSAMMQDRIGPTRAGIQLPFQLVELTQLAWKGAFAVAGLCLAALFYFAVLAKFDIVRGEAGTEIAMSGRSLLANPGVQIAFWLFVLHISAGFVLRAVFPQSGYVSAWGLMHSVADAMKMVWKEDFVPPHADKLLHSLAPIISLVPAFVTFAVIPFGDVLYPEALTVSLDPARFANGIPGPAVPLQVASLNVGILYIFAIAGTGVVGAAIAGYSSDNKWSLLGGMRAAGQMVSYEVTLGLALVPMFMMYGTLMLENMVHYQAEHRWGILSIPGFISAILYFTAATAETKRVPFDVPEGESELVGGYFTEYSSMKFAMFMTGEFLEVVTSSALVVTIFFGGYLLPFLEPAGFHVAFESLGIDWFVPVAHWGVTVLQIGTFLVKLGILIWFQLMIRWSLPRFRYDQIMKLCWRILLPTSLVNILIAAVIILLWP